MSQCESPDDGVSYDVRLTAPLLPAELLERLVAALHRADRNLGVGVGNPNKGDRTRLELLGAGSDQDLARSNATSLMVGAAKTVGLGRDFLRGMEIQQVVPRKLLAGKPRHLRAPALPGYRTLALPDGGILKAAHEGPTGDWIVYLEGTEERAFAGRDLLAVLSELFELPHGKKDAWVDEVIRQLAGRETPLGTRYPCPCCDFLTLDKPPPGTFALCPVCWWEDDDIQFSDLDYMGGANAVSLRQARERFRRLGVCDPRSIDSVRPPLPEERG